MTSKKTSAAINCIPYNQAFDNAVQANIIFILSSGKTIIANSAACKLLGYSKKEILTKKRDDFFNINEISFKKMLKQRATEGKSTAEITAIKKGGKPFPCMINSAVFMDEDGIQKVITTLTDMRQSIRKQKIIDTKKEKIVAGDIIVAQAKSDSLLAENNEWIERIAKTSYDVMWDWDIATDGIYIGDSIEEVFGYKIQNNTVKFLDFSQRLLPEEKERVENILSKTLASDSDSWSDSFMFKRKDGSVATTTIRASIVRDSEGKAIRLIGAMQDISKQIEAEEKLRQEILTKGKLLKQYNESFKFIFNSQSDVFFDSDLVTNKVKLSDAYEKEFGYKIIDNITPLENWISHIHPDDEKAVMTDYWRILASEDTEWRYNYRFVRADNSVANVLSRGIILRNASGKAYRMIGSIQDMSKQKVLEEKLGMEIEIKEQQIAEALEDAKASERSEIGKELHDNVNQLLGVSKLYLDMAKQGGEESELYLSRSSEYTNNAIEEIRKLTKGLTSDIIKTHGLCEAIDNIIRVTMEVNPVKISYEMKSFKEDNINNKFKLTVYRIIQEQLNNILKHAKAVEVSIKLLQTKTSIVLAISDNGIGFDIAEKGKGIGIANINSRATSYNGTADLASQPGQGCLLTVTFPVSDKLLEKTAAG